MKIKLFADETLSTGPAPAGSVITITPANADECYALHSTNKATLIDENAITTLVGDIGPSFATLVAQRSVNDGLSLSDAAPAVGLAAGAYISRVRLGSLAGPVTLVDDGGGRVALSGRSLVTGANGFVSGVPVTITLAANGTQRQFTLVPGAKRPTAFRVFNLKLSNTVKVRAGMAAAAAPLGAANKRNATFVVIAPSTGRGQSTGAGVTQAVNSWPMQLAAMMQKSGINAGANNVFGDAGAWGLGQTPSLANFLTGENRVTSSGAMTVGSGESVGGNSFSVSAAGTIGFTPQDAVTKFDLFWRDNGVGRQFTTQIDGGAPNLISSTGATAPVKTTVAAPGLSSHTLLASWAAGAVTLMGFSAYNDFGGRTEISIYNWGISGATSAQLIKDTDPAGGRIAMLNRVSPDCGILADLPINDWRTGVVVATSKANLKTAVAQVRTAGGTPIIVTPLPDGANLGLSASQQAYSDACYEVAIEDDVVLFDMRAAFVSWFDANAKGYESDSVHLAALGNTFYASMMQLGFAAIQQLG